MQKAICPGSTVSTGSLETSRVDEKSVSRCMADRYMGVTIDYTVCLGKACREPFFYIVPWPGSMAYSNGVPF